MSKQPLAVEPKTFDEKKQYYDQIVNTLSQKGNLSFNTDSSKSNPSQSPDIKIYVGRNLLDPENITDKQFTKLQQAIEQPSTLKNGASKGVVQIRVNNQPVFHNVRGEVIVDKFQLAQPQQKIEQPSQVVPPDQVLATNHSQLLATPQTQITHFEEIIASQQQRIEELEKKLAFLSQSATTTQNKSTSQWLSSTVANSTKGFGKVVTSWAEKKLEQLQNLSQTPSAKSVRYFDPLDMSDAQLKIAAMADASPNSHSWQNSQLQSQLQEIKTNLQSLKHNFEQTVHHVQQRVEPIASATMTHVVEPAVGKALQKMGVIYSPQNDASTKGSTTALSHYQRLSQAVDSKLPPSAQVKQIAIAAIKERFTPTQIQSILSQAPKFKEISSKLGMDKAKEFVGVALAAAQRQNAVDTQPKQQLQSQKQNQYQV